MTRSITSSRLRLPLALAFAATVALTGCQAGQDAQTSQDYNPGDGRNVNVPEDAAFDEDYIAVRNALVVSDGGAASLTVTLVNNGSDTDLLSEALLNGQPFELLGGPFELPPSERVAVGGGSERGALLPEGDVQPGDWAELTLSFAQAGTVTLDVVVISSDDEYALLGEDA
jgi:hypothetical protein